MMLFPAMMVGGHLVIAVVDKVPELNFEPICREAAGDNRVGKDDLATCRKAETDARDQLAKQWSEFGAADRARCIRLSSSNHAASYVEVVTCLEMGQAAKQLHKSVDTGIALPEPAPAPLALTPPPPPPQSRILQALCLPGLKSLLPACSPSGGTR